MLTSVKERLDREDEGFTLIELMVVVLIIAILLAIAIPTFLGARGQANSRAAQSSLRNSLTAEQTYYTSNQLFDDTSGTPSITTIEPNLSWNSNAAMTGMAENPNAIYVTLADTTAPSDTVVLQTYAKDGNCYSVFQTNGQAGATGGTGYAVTAGACVHPTLSNSVATASPTILTTSASASPGAAGAPGTWYSKW
jgi:type IV pilus assembly protein PilA